MLEDIKKLYFDKTKCYIVAVSGGPDSMALLDMLSKMKLTLLVCHINYKTRELSDYEEELVKKYCLKHGHQFYSKVVDYYKKGNFQDFARVERYQFFASIYISHQAAALLVAHHQDDAIETYLLQKQRKSYVKYYGLPYESKVQNMRILRPLLNMTKKEILQYCVDYQIEYSIDITNSVPKYARNYVRLKIINELDSIQREKILLAMQQDQLKNQKDNDYILKLMRTIMEDDAIVFNRLMALSNQEQEKIIYLYLSDYLGILSKHLSRARLKDYLEKIKSSKPNIQIVLSSVYVLMKEYNYIKVINCHDYHNYTYIINNKEEVMVTPWFKISNNGDNKNEIMAFDEDYPLTIRPYKTGDKIKTKEGHKKINRIFIDKKVPMQIRSIYPIVAAKNGEVIFIPSLYKDYARKTLQTGQFMVKLVCYK